MGATLVRELTVGGAAYIPTGRGLAIERQSFAQLFAGFATSCFYPGFELLMLLCLTPLASEAGSNKMAETPSATFVVAAIMPFSLLFGAFLFNPRCFEPRLCAADFRAWLEPRLLMLGGALARPSGAGLAGWV